MSEIVKTRLLSIDAWRDDEKSWYWDSWFTVEEGIYWESWRRMTPRRIFKKFREWGYLTDVSKGRLAIDNDGYNLVIVNKDTREPVLALCYGEYNY